MESYRPGRGPVHGSWHGRTWPVESARAGVDAGAMLLVRGLTRRIHAAVAIAEAIARGDLRADVSAEGRDEVAQLRRAMGEMSTRLAGIIGEVRGGAESVSAAAEELTATSQTLADGTGRQIASLLDTSAGLQQMRAGKSVNLLPSVVYIVQY